MHATGRPRGLFEPAHPIPSDPAEARMTRPPSSPAGSSPAAPPPAGTRPPSPAAAKLDQIKDLYLTAEAIGEDALARHFQQVSERQRQLIREYFNEVVSGSGAAEGDPAGS